MSTDFNCSTEIVLGSRSPRRIELLSLLVPPQRIRILPPADEAEDGFSGLTTLPQIHQQLACIARTKNFAVQTQLDADPPLPILTADTIVIVREPTSEYTVLGKPDGPDWQETTRAWFRRYYSNARHLVVTGVCLTSGKHLLHEFQVQTEIQFGSISDEELDWYLKTQEPLGKAGGYGLQGAASMFVECVHGSSSSVIGLPLAETWIALKSLHLI